MFDKTIHHRRSVRIPGYDYGLPDFYFITICAADKKCIFGRVVDGMMKLNILGKLVQNAILDIPIHCDNRVKIHESIVMPNHIHFVMEIIGAAVVGADIIRPGNNEPGRMISAPTTRSSYKYSKTVGSVIRGFKSGVTKKIGCSVWQRNYYEHIIRDNADYDKISNYIFTNPQTWDADILFQKQLDEFNEQFNL